MFGYDTMVTKGVRTMSILENPSLQVNPYSYPPLWGRKPAKQLRPSKVGLAPIALLICHYLFTCFGKWKSTPRVPCVTVMARFALGRSAGQSNSKRYTYHHPTPHQDKQ